MGKETAVVDPCATDVGNRCQHFCLNQGNGRAKCQCFPGFRLADDQISCIGSIRNLINRKMCKLLKMLMNAENWAMFVRLVARTRREDIAAFAQTDSDWPRMGMVVSQPLPNCQVSQKGKNGKNYPFLGFRTFLFLNSIFPARVRVSSVLPKFLSPFSVLSSFSASGQFLLDQPHSHEQQQQPERLKVRGIAQHRGDSSMDGSVESAKGRQTKFTPFGTK